LSDRSRRPARTAGGRTGGVARRIGRDQQKADRIIGEQISNKNRKTDERAIDCCANGMEPFEAAQDIDIVSEPWPLLAVFGYDDDARDRDQHSANGQRRKPRIAGAPGRNCTDQQGGCRADDEREERRVQIVDQLAIDFRRWQLGRCATDQRL
jgi:hypothetical protein